MDLRQMQKYAYATPVQHRQETKNEYPLKDYLMYDFQTKNIKNTQSYKK